MFSSPNRHAKGFTLVELIVVLVVLALLAAIAIPTYQRVVTRSDEKKTEAEMDSMQSNAYNIWFASQESSSPITMADALEIAAGEMTISALGDGNFAAGTTFTAVESRRASQHYGDVVYTIVGAADTDLIDDTGVLAGDIAFSMRTRTGSFCWAAVGPITDIVPTCGPGVAGRPDAGPNATTDNGGQEEEQISSALGKPIGLDAVAGDGEAYLTWTPLGSGDVTGYLIYLFDETSPHGVPIAGDATLGQAVVSNLVNGQPYVIRIRAVNGSELGPLSDPAVVTPLTGPGQVQGVEVTPGVEKLYVTWANNNYTGAPVEYWDVLVDGVSAGPSPKGQAWKLLTGLNAGQLYTVTVVAHGTTTAPASLPAAGTPHAAGVSADLVFAAPAAPSNLVAIGGNAKVTLAWPPSVTTRFEPVASYSVYVINPQTGDPVEVIPSDVEVLEGTWRVEVTTTPFGTLQNGTTYTFHVTANGPGGLSSPSPSASATPGATTTIPTPGSSYMPPQGPITLSGAGGNLAARLVWTAVENLPNAPVTGYQLYQDGEPILTQPSNKLNAVIDGLENGTTYLFQVAAVGPGGRGELSEPFAITPDFQMEMRYLAVNPPVAPPVVSGLAAFAGNTKLSLRWNRLVATTITPIWGYRVYLNGSAAPALIVPQPADPKLSAVETDLTGLTNGVPYSVQIEAFNMKNGPLSAAVTATPYGLPAQPVNVIATSPASATVTVSWDDIAATTAVPISGYRIHINGSAAPSAAVGAGVTTKTIVGLTNGVTYSFQVVAFNSVGLGPMSAAVTATPSNPPEPVSSVTATGANERIFVTWAQVPNTATTPTLGYDVYMDGELYGRYAQLVQTNNGMALPTQSITINGVANGVQHAFQVIAYNNTATSPASPVAYGAAVPVPGSVTVSLVEQRQLDVIVSWTEPTGGGPHSGYRIYTNGSLHAAVNVPTQTFTLPIGTGPTAIQVVAVNAYDSGPASAALNVVRYDAPSAVGALAFNPPPAASATSVTFTWEDPISSTYSPRDGYRVWVNDQPTGQTLPTTATSATVSGLSYGVTYKFTIEAFGVGGSRNSSGFVSHTAYTLPGQATGLAVSDESDGKVTLSWNRVEGSASAPVTGYQIYKNAVMQKLVADSTCADAVCSTVIDGLTNGTTYALNVRAYGAGGVGATSETAYGLPLAPLVISTTEVPVPFSDSFTVAGGLSSSWVTAGDTTTANSNAYVLGSASILAGATPNSDWRLTATTYQSPTFNIIFRAQDENNYWALRRYNINGLPQPCQLQLTVTINGIRTVVQNWPQAGGSCATEPFSHPVVITSKPDGALNVFILANVSYSITDNRLADARGLALQAGTFSAVDVTASPAMPSNLSATATSGSSADITWTGGLGTDTYTVTAVDQVNGATSGSCTTSTTSCTISTLKRAHSYTLSLIGQRDGVPAPEVTTTITTPSTFAFSSFTDNNGIIYYLATLADTQTWENPGNSGFIAAWPQWGVTVSAAAGTFNGALFNVTDYGRQSDGGGTATYTGGIYNQGRTLQLDLPPNRSVSPSDIALRFPTLYGQVTVSGSNNGDTWDTLGTYGAVNSATIQNIRINPANPLPYSKIRINFYHPNAGSVGGSPNSYLSDVELYGTLHNFVLAPPALGATGAAYKNVLTWTGGQADEWVVKRGSSAIATLPAGQTSFEDLTAPTGVASSYTIIPKAADGTLGQPSTTVSATAYVPVAPAKPTAVTITRGVAQLYVGYTEGAPGTSTPTYSALCTSSSGTYSGAGSKPISVPVPDTTTDGLTYTCTVTAASSDGSNTSDPVAYTIQSYTTYLSGLNPTFWWTHTQPAGTSTVPSQTGAKSLNVFSGVTFGAAAAISGRTTAQFNGSTGYESLTATAFGNFTINAVICTSGTVSQQAIYTQRPTGTFSNAAGQGQINFYINANGKLDLSIGTNAGTLNRTIGGTTLAANTCYSLTAVRNGSTGYLYVNGAEDATGTLNSNAGQTGHGANIGRDARDGGAFLNGRVGDVAIWTSALLPLQISTLHANTGL